MNMTSKSRYVLRPALLASYVCQLPVASVLSTTCEQVEVLQESKNMVPDCQRRLEAAHTDLKAVIVSHLDSLYSMD